MTKPAATTAADALLEIGPRLGRLLAAALDLRPGPELSLRQFRILQRLIEGPQRAADLAASTGVTPPTMSVAVATLEANGWVSRRPDTADRRAASVSISPAGRAVYDQARAWLHDLLVIVAAELGKDDADALQRLRVPLQAGMDRARAHLRQLPREAPPPAATAPRAAPPSTP